MLAQEHLDILTKKYTKRPQDEENLHQIATIISNQPILRFNLTENLLKDLIKDIFETRSNDINLSGTIMVAQQILAKDIEDQNKVASLRHNGCNKKVFDEVKAASQNILLLKLLSLTVNTKLQIEIYLRALRYEILVNYAQYSSAFDLRPIIEAISKQVYLNEFIYDETEKEKSIIENITLSLCARNASHNFNWSNIQLLSMYRDLSDFEILKKALFPKNFLLVWSSRLKDQLAEEKIIKDIQKDNFIEDKISKKVRSQYEENPYPRWETRKKLSQNKTSLKSHLEISYKLKVKSKIFKKNKKRVLIAGCGTGQQVYWLKDRVGDVNVDAVDLSLKSLAYAQREISKLGPSDINFYQKNILNFTPKEIGTFDYVECAGVLHHLEHPSVGLKKLHGIMNEDGLLKLGLYSKKARKPLEPLKKLIENNGLKEFSTEAKYFREWLVTQALAGNEICKYVFERIADVYSLSNFRDLLFHPMEHQFDLLDVKKLLQECGFEFLGLYARKSSHDQNYDLFIRKFNLKHISIKQWDDFEQSYPNTFLGMYHILARRL